MSDSIDTTAVVSAEVGGPEAVLANAQAANAAADAASAAEAIAAMREARSAEVAAEKVEAPEPTPSESEPGEPAESAEPATAEPKAEEKTASPDPKAEELLKRLNAVEAKARAESAKAKELEARVAQLAKWEKAAEAAKAGNAKGVFDMMEWTPETVEKYLQGGEAALEPDRVAKGVQTVAEQLAQLKAELAARDAAETVRTYKSTITQDFSAIKAEVPTLAEFYTDPETGTLDTGAAAEAIWAFQVAMYNRVGPDGSPAPIELTHQEAAKALEDSHRRTKLRYTGRSAASSKTVDPPAAKSGTEAKAVAPASKVVPTRVALPARGTEEAADADEADALAVLAAARAARVKTA